MNICFQKLETLTLRLGYPYVYQHQGDCEHIIIFSDIRFTNAKDPSDSQAYPYYKNINRYLSQICMVCGTSSAKWVCVDSNRLPHEHSYLCQECFLSYNYIDGEKIGNFKAFPYFDKALVL